MNKSKKSRAIRAKKFNFPAVAALLFLLWPAAAGAQSSGPVSISAEALPPPRGSVILIPSTVLSFSGRAYPAGRISILKDGQTLITVVADRNADFFSTITTLPPGNYNFTVAGMDAFGRQSPGLNFFVVVRRDTTTYVQNIFVPPTVAIDKVEVVKGESVRVFGSTVPLGLVSIALDYKTFIETRADAEGNYTYALNTDALESRTYVSKSKTSVGGVQSPDSHLVNFKVGPRTLPSPLYCETIRADLNCDGRVNLVDFSILTFWFRKEPVPERVNLDYLDNVNMADFSIMAYYWTG